MPKFYEHPCPTVAHRADGPPAPSPNRIGPERRERERERAGAGGGWGIGSTSIFRHVKPLAMATAAAAAAATDSAHTKRKKGTYSTSDLKKPAAHHATLRHPSESEPPGPPLYPILRTINRAPLSWDFWPLTSPSIRITPPHVSKFAKCAQEP